MTSGTHTINRSHQPCVEVTPRTITPNGSRTWVSGAGCGRSNKEFKALILKTEHKQTLQSVAVLIASNEFWLVERIYRI